jgi:squalene-associated FAD-dependent desaturase
VLSSSRRVKGTNPFSYLAAQRLLKAAPEAVVTDLLDAKSTLYRRLWQPMAVAALNTEPELGSAQMFGDILQETLGAGGQDCVPMIPRDGLSESMIYPALARLRAKGADIRIGSRLRGITFANDRAATLDFEGAAETLGPNDAVLLAVPSRVAPRLVPEMTAPDEYRAIVNAHYRIALRGAAPWFVGVIGGTAEWVFRKPDILSVTVSAADRLVDRSADELAPLLWRDVAAAFALPEDPMPVWQIVKEKRATFAATPAQIKRRPDTVTRWPNLFLAGDWTDTGLPATIEGAIRSGFKAADRLLGQPQIR